MNENNKIYDLKFYIPTDYNDVLVFHAWVKDEESYYIFQVKDFNVNETYKEIFLDIIKGTLEIKYFKNKKKIITKNNFAKTLSKRIINSKEILEESYNIKYVQENINIFKIFSSLHIISQNSLPLLKINENGIGNLSTFAKEKSLFPEPLGKKHTIDNSFIQDIHSDNDIPIIATGEINISENNFSSVKTNGKKYLHKN